MSTIGEITAERDPIMVATPSFVVGADADGRWLVVETHGKGGGIFVSRRAAIEYARAESCRRPGCVALADEPIALR